MRFFTFAIVSLFIHINLSAQTVVAERVSDLMPEMYPIEGDALLQEYDNGVLTLSLTDAFTTPRGPDVRIFLSNTTSFADGVEIVNLSDINHFSGAYSIDLPSSIGIEDYNYILFFCVTFEQFWASGQFGDVTTPGGDFECMANETSGNNGAALIDICPSDNAVDLITFSNSLNEPAGEHYAYLITDENETLQEVVLTDSYDFEGSDMETQRVYGIHYDGQLNPAIGSGRLQTMATGCFTHAQGDFLTITKSACSAPFVCMQSSTTADDGAFIVDICPSDNMADFINFSNNIGAPAGEHYAYLITDENQILQEVVFNNFHNFEGSNSSAQRVYGVHYDGQLNPVVGSGRLQTTATGCFIHSQGSFLTITKSACTAPYECMDNLTATTDWVTAVEICATDGLADNVALRNNLFIAPGSHYAYLLTDANEMLEAVILDSVYNFEGSGETEHRIYGVNYDGTLNPAIGQHRSQTTASECHTHSGDNLFLTIQKTGCAIYECMDNLTATTDWVTEVEICATDGLADNVALRNNLIIAPGSHYAYLLTDANEVLEAVILDSVYNFEGSGEAEHRIYGINYDGTLNPAIGQHRSQTTASECHTHSGDNLFLTIQKTGCVEYECRESLTATHNWVTDIDLCATDGQSDEVFIQNNIQVEPGSHYAFLLTDANEILQEVILDTVYDFEGTGIDEQRIYGLNYSGTLSSAIGEHRTNTTASECFIHSGDNLFITINKTAACVTSVLDPDLAEQILIYPNPTSDVIFIRTPAAFKPTTLTLYNMLGSRIKAWNTSRSENIEADLSELNLGHYIIVLEDSDKTYAQKITVIK